MCAFLCLVGYSLSQILIISVLHVAQFMQFIDNGLRSEFRRPLGDDILPKRKHYEYKGERGDVELGRGDAELGSMDAEHRRGDAELRRRDAEWNARKGRFVSSMKEASQYHLVVDTIIATVAFTAGITMPGGFRDHDGSAVLTGNAAFKAFVITNTIAMVQSCSAAFIHLFMPLSFQDANLIGDFPFVLASLAFWLSIFAMGAMMLAFVTGTYAVLMHSLNLAIANSVIGLFFFIPFFFVSIGCSQYLREMWSIGLSWFFKTVVLFLLLFIWGICCCLPSSCCSLCVSCYESLADLFPRRSQRSRNDADQSTAS